MIRQTTKTLAQKFVTFLTSRWFYFFVLLFFAFEAVWIAYSALYPQAFDENFHFGLIKVYSHYWLPFLSGQPPHANAYGAVARDPSYLYHYLMSFPYRFLALFIHTQKWQVISLRLIDIGFFIAGIELFRRVLLKARVSRAFTHTSLFLFVLIPIVPQLAAQISYDDLLFPLVALTCLLAFKVTDGIIGHRISIRNILILAIVGLLTGLVKYAFLPILLGVVCFLLVILFVTYRHNFASLWKMSVDDFRSMSLVTKVILPILFLLAVGLFVQRDGVNLLKYHVIAPDCAKVLHSTKECSAYSPWHADYVRHQHVLAGTKTPSANIFVYTGEWFYWMWYRLFFAVNGLKSGFSNKPPLPLPSITAALVAIVGIVVLIKYWRKIFHNNYYARFLLTIAAFYTITLFAKGRTTYEYTAVLENMNGRYLIPVLLPLIGVVGLALSQAFYRFKTSKALVTAFVMLLFLQGGGLFTFILRSNDTWFWSDDNVVHINKTARKVLKHVVVTKKEKK